MSFSLSKKRCDFTRGGMVLQVFRFAIPILITSVLQMTFNTADTIMVGRWGGNSPAECEAALAAVGSCASLISLITTFFMGLSVGASVTVAYDVGAKDLDGVKKTVHTSATFAAIGGIAVSLLGLILLKPALLWMGTDPSVMDQAVPYMRAYMLGVPANILYNYCAACLRATGDTVRPLIFLTSGGIANVAFNSVFIYAFRMGALGVGIATAISFWLSCAMILIYMAKNRGLCHLELRALRIDKKILVKMLKIGVPAGIEDSLFSVSNVLIQSSINSFGPIAMAGNAASKSIDGYLGVINGAFCQSAITAVGQNNGAKRFDRVKKSILVCAVIMVAVNLTVSIPIHLFGSSLIGIYAPDNPQVVEMGLKRLKIMASTYFIAGLMSMGSYVLRGLGKSFTSTAISLVGTCALRILWLYTVLRWFRYFEVIFIAYPVTWTVTAIVTYIMIFMTLKKIIKENTYG